MNDGITQIANVVRPIDHGSFVQLLCADDRGLISVYFDYTPFNLFSRQICKAGLDLKGLQIKCGRNTVRVPALGRKTAILRTRSK